MGINGNNRKRVKEKIYTIPERPLRVRDIPERMRPREVMDRMGAVQVPDDVLIAILLRSGVRGCNVVELADRLLMQYGSLTELSRASVDELAAIHGMGRVKAQVLAAALEIGRRILIEATPEREAIRTPEQAARIIHAKTQGREEESFWVLILDIKNRLKRSPMEISRGLLDASLVHPREVFREAIRASGAAVVIGHNHPSGDTTPSTADLRITRQLIDSGRILNIEVLDHVIVGQCCRGQSLNFMSLREEGIVKFKDK
jgi:DNA repair protein RadC